MTIEPLLQIGLSSHEAETYLELLPMGSVPISELIARTAQYPQTIYRAIDQLAARGLVIVTTRKHRKYVEAEHPRVLHEMEKRKLQKLTDLLPEMSALLQSPKEAMVRIARGKEAVRNLRFRGIDELKKDETYYVMGASGDLFYEVMGDSYRTLEKRRIEKGIRRLLLSSESQRALISKREKDENFRQLAQYRYLTESFPVLTSTNIFGSTVAILIWAQEPIVITIESKEVAESYRQYFMTLWKIAKE